MKILIISDLHLDWVTHGVPRLSDLESALEIVLDTVQAEDVETVLVLGDLFDPDGGSGVFQAMSVAINFASVLSRADVTSLWIAGNHDVIEDGSGTTTLSPLAAMGDPRIIVHERPGNERIGGIDFITLPFTASSHRYDPDEWVRQSMPSKGRKVVVAGHMTNIPEVTPGEETTEMPRGREVRFPIEAAAGATLLLNGHYHKRQRTPGGIWIPGSLARLTFGEETHTPGFLMVEV